MIEKDAVEKFMKDVKDGKLSPSEIAQSIVSVAAYNVENTPEPAKSPVKITPRDLYQVRDPSDGVVLIGAGKYAVKNEQDLPEGMMAYLSKSGSSNIGPLMVKKVGGKTILTRHDIHFTVLDERTQDGYVKCSLVPVVNPEMEKFSGWGARKSV